MFSHPPSSWAVVIDSEAAALGGRWPGFQPGGSWVVLTDPGGHAFCLVADD